MKVYVKDSVYQAYFKEHFPKNITLVNEKKDAEILVSGVFKESDMNSNLKGVIIPYTGYNMIDLEAMKKHNLMLFNTVIHSDYVAEKAMNLMHGLLGKTVLYHTRLKEGYWSYRTTPKRTPWVSAQRKNFGIYGYGRIGKKLHDFLKPFNGNVVVIDRGKKYPGCKTVKDLEALVDESDIVFVTTPLNAHTKGAFDKNILKRFSDKYLINVGRGAVIDEKALYDALKNQTLRGFASDVWYQYPKDEEKTMPSHFPIESFDNVLLSPHCGGHTEHSHHEMMHDVLEKIIRIAQGDTSDKLILETLK